MGVQEILLAQPRGFCAGVDRAIEIVEKAIEINKFVSDSNERELTKIVRRATNIGMVF